MGNYLAIEQVRFADRLRVEMNVDPSAVDGLVPSFLLQPIVENAIRHGIAHCEHEGLVEASAIRDGDELHLRVRDTGTGMMLRATERAWHRTEQYPRAPRPLLSRRLQDAGAATAVQAALKWPSPSPTNARGYEDQSPHRG